MPIVQVIIPNNLGATLDANFLAANKYDANPADLALSMPVSPPVIGAQGALGGALDKDFYVGKDGLLHQLPSGGAASVVTTFTVTPTTLDVAVDGTAVMSVLLSSLAAALPIPPSTQTTFAVVGANLEAAVDGTAPIQISLTALAAALNAASATPEQHVVSGAVVGTNLVLTLNDLSTVIIDVTSLLNVHSTQTTFGIVGANIEAAVDGTAPLQLPLATLATALLPSLPPDKYVVSAVLDILNNLTLTLSDASTVVVSLATLANTPSVQSTFQISGANIEAAVDGTAVQVVSLAALAAALAPFLPAETFLAGAIYNPLTFTLTLTLNDATTVVVNLQDLIPVTAISGIQGNGTAATPLKENFDNLPVAPAVLLPATNIVVANDGTNNDGSIATLTALANAISAVLPAELHVVSGVVAGNNLTLTLNDASTVVIDVTTLAADKFVVSATLSGANILTLTLNDASVVTVDLSALANVASVQTTFAIVGANIEAAVDGTAAQQLPLATLATALVPLLPAEKYVVSGTVAGNNLTLTFNDASTVVIDVTTLAADLDKFVTAVAFSPITNILTLTFNDASTLTTSLAALANVASVQSTFAIVGANIEAAVDGTAVQQISLAALAAALTPLLTAEKYVTSGVVAGNNLTLTFNDASTVVIDVTTLATDLNKFVTAASFAPATNILTLTFNDASTVTVDLTVLAKSVTASGIQGNGQTATPIKENFDNLPAAPAVLPATTKFVVSTDGTNNDGSQALEQSVADYLIMTGATPLAAGSIGTVPAPLAGQDTFFFRGDASWQPLSGIVGGSIQMFEDRGLNGFFRLDQNAGPTNMQPWAAPQDCVIYGMSVTNKNIGANATITFFKNGVALVPNIVLNPFLNAVTAVAPFPIVMARGDRLSVSGVGTSDDTILNIQWYATAAPPATTVLRNALP